MLIIFKFTGHYSDENRDQERIEIRRLVKGAELQDFQIELKSVMWDFVWAKDLKSQKYEKLSVSSSRGHHHLLGTHPYSTVLRVCVGVCICQDAEWGVEHIVPDHRGTISNTHTHTY